MKRCVTVTVTVKTVMWNNELCVTVTVKTDEEVYEEVYDSDSDVER